MVEGTRDWMAVWKDMRFEAREYRELDSERVLVLFRFRGRGKTSGLAIDDISAAGAHVFHVRAGRVTRLVAYFDQDQALADLGLAPEPDSPRS